MRIATLLVVLGGSLSLAPPALALQREPVRKPERPARERADTGRSTPGQSRPTKPKASDLFFVGTTNLERGHLNSKNSVYIVARDIEIAGWLVQPWWKSNPNDPNSGFEVNPHGGEPAPRTSTTSSLSIPTSLRRGTGPARCCPAPCCPAIPGTSR
ncbi:MAG: hypothetical protein M3068_05430 [Gemmatimonadota bacterium]|nr:hypothetical protein [Gemmatimonadota bacterium]